jgi:hypothetical protein
MGIKFKKKCFFNLEPALLNHMLLSTNQRKKTATHIKQSSSSLLYLHVQLTPMYSQVYQIIKIGQEITSITKKQICCCSPLPDSLFYLYKNSRIPYIESCFAVLMKDTYFTDFREKGIIIIISHFMAV